jgi:hypothetical protein
LQVAPAANAPGLAHVVEGSMAKGLPAVRASDVMLRAINWLFVRETVLMALDSLIATLPKAKVVAESVVGAISVPVSVTSCGVLLAFVLIVRVPVCGPVVVGVRVTPILQVAPAAKAPGLAHVVDGSIAKGLPAGRVSDVMLRAVNWLFLRDTVLMALVSLITTFPKAKVVAESVVGAIPVPVSDTVLLPAVVVMVKVPVAAPREEGVSVIPMVQLAPAARPPGLAHVDEAPTLTAYSLPAGTEYELMVMAAEPVFLRVTFDTELVSPTTTLPKASAVGVTVVCATPNAENKRHDVIVDNSRTTFWNFGIRFTPSHGRWPEGLKVKGARWAIELDFFTRCVAVASALGNLA